MTAMPLTAAEQGQGSHHRVRHADEDEVEDAIVDVDEDGEAEASAGRLEDALEQARNCAAKECHLPAWEPSKGALPGAPVITTGLHKTLGQKTSRADTCPGVI